MANHPVRSGAISAQLFAEFVDELLTISPVRSETAVMDIKQHILKAAMRIAMQRASRKFRWIPNVDWEADWDSFGQPYNIRIGLGRLSVTAAEYAWIFAEVREIAKHALSALARGAS